MKKLFSMASMYLLIFTLVGCDVDFNMNSHDNQITISLNDGYGELTSETIGFDDDYDGSLLDLIDENFDVGFTISEYGAYITKIEGITTMQGNYIALMKNGEASTMGADTVEFNDGDEFLFELTWWDPGLQAVYQAIQLFLDNHADDYVNDTTADFNVVLGLNLLRVLDDYIDQGEMEALVETTELTSNAEYFKAIMRLGCFPSYLRDLTEGLYSNATVSGYGGTAYALLAFNSYSHSIDFSSFEVNALDSFETESPYDLGLDAGGISIVALSEYVGDETIDTYISDFATWVSTDQLPTGGIMTRDTGWGSSENAASMSQVIIGLIANDIDPRSVDYTKGTNNLISRLLEFQTETGSFDWDLTDEVTEDLAFSTPQAFLALVVYQEYVNTMSPVNPYSFK